MKSAIRRITLVFASVAGLAVFAATEASADHYWSSSHNRYVTYELSYQHHNGYPVFVNEFGRHFRHGHNGHRIWVSSHYNPYSHHYTSHYVRPHHRSRHGVHHGGLFEILFGH